MMPKPQPARAPAPAHTPKVRPDARPMRLALGGGGIAVLSALATAIVLPPQPAAPVAIDDPQQEVTEPPATQLQVKRPVQYVQLAPGETAPPGAKVIDASAPTPMTVVVTITAAPQPTTRKTTVKTTQSGRVVP